MCRRYTTLDRARALLALEADSAATRPARRRAAKRAADGRRVREQVRTRVRGRLSGAVLSAWTWAFTWWGGCIRVGMCVRRARGVPWYNTRPHPSHAACSGASCGRGGGEGGPPRRVCGRVVGGGGARSVALRPGAHGAEGRSKVRLTRRRRRRAHWPARRRGGACSGCDERVGAVAAPRGRRDDA